MRVGYVVSTAANIHYALEQENIIAACFTGPNPNADALSYAKDYTRAEEKPSYVYMVSIEARQKYEIKKEVVGSAHSQ